MGKPFWESVPSFRVVRLVVVEHCPEPPGAKVVSAITPGRDDPIILLTQYNNSNNRTRVPFPWNFPYSSAGLFLGTQKEDRHPLRWKSRWRVQPPEAYGLNFRRIGGVYSEGKSCRMTRPKDTIAFCFQGMWDDNNKRRARPPRTCARRKR